MLTPALLEAAIKSPDPETVALAHRYLDALEADTCTKSFKSFVKLFWPLVSPSPLKEGWYLDALCDHLQHITDIKRLLINLPPRHGKSTLVAVLFPAWIWTWRPQTKLICSSYSLQNLSARDSTACRDVIQSPTYQRNWGHLFSLSSDRNTKYRFDNDKLGFRMATSCESANLGEGGDLLIADDLNNVAEIHSPTQRAKVINWWTSVMSTRLNPAGLNSKIVIQQRCHEDDITGYILGHDDTKDWTHLVLPWEFDPDRRTVTSLGWTDPRTKEGEPLSDLYTSEQIDERKGGNGLGPTGFATQFNQRPAPAAGSVFQKDWFKTYHETDKLFLLDGTPCPKDACSCVITTDLAISLKTTADYTVAQTWLITPHNHLILIDQWRERVEGPDAIKQFKKLVAEYRPDAIYVEDVAFQKLMIQLLKQHGLPVKPLNPCGQDKKARCQRSVVKAECGQIWLPEKADWLDDWQREVTSFPNAAHDDQLDCLAWAGIVANRYPVGKLPEIPKVLSPEEQAAENRKKMVQFMWAGLDD